MPHPDYGSVLAQIQDASPAAIRSLVEQAAAPLGGGDITIYMVDFAGVVLQPLALVLDEPVLPEEDVASTMAGRAYRTGEPVTARRRAGVRVWVPLLEQTDRTGVLALTVPRATASVVHQCVQLGLFTGLLIASAARYTDLLHVRRRGQSMALAASMQWDLLPPLTLRCPRAISCGLLQPAYEIAGDGFDHALNGDWLHLAVFDGMGHGIRSTLLTTLTVGAYRHARRTGADLAEAHQVICQVMAEQFKGDAFSTGLLLRLHLPSGRLEWINAGHCLPLLVRNGSVVGELACPPSLPFGLEEARWDAVAVEALQPGDRVLLYTDGVVEGRNGGGAEFGLDRLIDLLGRELSWPAEEIVRRVVQAVLDWQEGKIRDDATLVMLQWIGPDAGA